MKTAERAVAAEVELRLEGIDQAPVATPRGLLEGLGVEESLRRGWAHGALLTTYPGDTTMANRELVEALSHGGGARIER